ncbi:Cyclin-l1 [Globisporangium polare]
MTTTANGTAPPVHVLLPASILDRSPSLQDRVSADVERAHRFFGCEVIQEAGVLLRLPQVVMATAQTMLHRFFYRKSLRDFDAFRVAFACLFLATKVEERPKRIKDVLSVFYALYKRRKWRQTKRKHQLLDLDGATYSLWRDWMVLVERQILIDLGFSVYNVMEHPHKYILYYVKIVGGSKELAQKTWGYINDSLRIDLCVRVRSEVIACAAIFLASRILGVKLPDDPHWYALFDVEKRELYEVSIEIMELYSREKVEWLDPLTEVDPFAEDDSGSHSPGEEEVQAAAVNGAVATTAGNTKAVAEQVSESPQGPESVPVAQTAQQTATVEPTRQAPVVEPAPVERAPAEARRGREDRREDDRRSSRSRRSRDRSPDRQRRRRSRSRSSGRRRSNNTSSSSRRRRSSSRSSSRRRR